MMTSREIVKIKLLKLEGRERRKKIEPGSVLKF
jgi:hypothetical protein